VTETGPQSVGEAVRDVVVLNRFGMHARPAALLVKMASRFRANVELVKDGVAVSAKSIMGVLTLGCEHGAQVRVRARGEDAAEAVAAVAELFDLKFHEE